MKYEITCCCHVQVDKDGNYTSDGYHCAGISQHYHCQYCRKDFHPNKEGWKERKKVHEENCVSKLR